MKKNIVLLLSLGVGVGVGLYAAKKITSPKRMSHQETTLPPKKEGAIVEQLYDELELLAQRVELLETKNE